MADWNSPAWACAETAESTAFALKAACIVRKHWSDCCTITRACTASSTSATNLCVACGRIISTKFGKTVAWSFSCNRKRAGDTSILNSTVAARISAVTSLIPSARPVVSKSHQVTRRNRTTDSSALLVAKDRRTGNQRTSRVDAAILHTVTGDGKFVGPIVKRTDKSGAVISSSAQRKCHIRIGRRGRRSMNSIFICRAVSERSAWRVGIKAEPQRVFRPFPGRNSAHNLCAARKRHDHPRKQHCRPLCRDCRLIPDSLHTAVLYPPRLAGSSAS